MNTAKRTIIAAAMAVIFAGSASADEQALDSIIPEETPGVDQVLGESSEAPRVTYLLDDSVYGSTYAEDTVEANPYDDSYGSDCGCGSDFGCGNGCGCGNDCCNSCGNGGCSCFGDCCLGDPWTLHDEIDPCCQTNYGGWFSLGYHSDTTGLSRQFDDGLAFNDLPGKLNLHQAWLFVERTPDADCCSADWGYRYDIMYGTDAQKLQATGNPGAEVRNQGTWDASLDHGYYGWAMPQAYGEVAYGDLTVKVGHFITPVGFEYVTAPQNFFYSHSLTSFNSEPFTHTGVLSTYQASDDLKIYNGWTLGWDTGFDQFFSGSNYLGGFEREMTDGVTLAYLCTAGNFGYRSGGEPGYMHGAYVTIETSDAMEYGLYTMYYNSEGSFGDPTFDLEEYSVVNYLFYTVNDCWALGGRAEWWKSNEVTGEATSFYEVTGGINYAPHANVVFRPEIRYDWTPSEQAVGGPGPYDRWIFGIDAVITY